MSSKSDRGKRRASSLVEDAELQPKKQKVVHADDTNEHSSLEASSAIADAEFQHVSNPEEVTEVPASDTSSTAAEAEVQPGKSDSKEQTVANPDGTTENPASKAPSATAERVDQPGKAKRQAASAPEEEPQSKKQKVHHRDESAEESTSDLPFVVAGGEVQEDDTEDDGEQEDIGAIQPADAPVATPQTRVPVKTLFTPFTHNVAIPTTSDPYWGRIPMPGPEGPRHLPDLPPARTSNAATVPPLWEDRKFKFVPGQYHYAFGPMQDELTEEASDDAPLLNQEENLVIKLMDMRPISKHNQAPRRKPVVYTYANGKPNDWNNLQTIKALNDRRREAITRLTLDTPWSEMERFYLCELVNKYEHASIEELAQRFNHRFVGDFKEESALSYCELHKGRTLESIRHEYLSYKWLYDRAMYPDPIRPEGDKTNFKKVNNRKVKTAAEIIMEKFEKPARTRISTVSPKTDDLEKEAVEKSIDEELLELSGSNNPDKIPDNSPLSESEKADVLKNLDSQLKAAIAEAVQLKAKIRLLSTQATEPPSGSSSHRESKSSRTSVSPRLSASSGVSKSRRYSQSPRSLKSPPQSKSPNVEQLRLGPVFGIQIFGDQAQRSSGTPSVVGENLASQDKASGSPESTGEAQNIGTLDTPRLRPSHGSSEEVQEGPHGENTPEEDVNDPGSQSKRQDNQEGVEEEEDEEL